MSAKTMREIREALGYSVPPEGIPDPKVFTTRHEISCLPRNHPRYNDLKIIVELRDRYGWSVHNGRCYLGRDGLWVDVETVRTHEGDGQWIANHRFSENMAILLARQAAPHIKTYDGITIADALSMSDK